ncbi:MAG: HAD-IB family phosphatase [Elusimicrobiales bacterium]
MSRFALVTDFDGTVTTRDVGDFICLRFGVATAEDIELSYAAGVCVQDWVKKFFGRLRRGPDEVRSLVLGKIRMRAGFAEAARLLAQNGAPVEITSGGLDIYIKPLLEKWGAPDIKLFCGAARYGKNGYRVRYPWKMKLDDLKASRVRFHRRRGRKVIFCGDAASDFRAARAADIVFARGRLLEMCRAAGVKAAPLESFSAVAEAAGLVRRDGSGRRAQTGARCQSRGKTAKAGAR